jgi:replicative DNA helicase
VNFYTIDRKNRKIDLLVAKNRTGSTGTCNLTFEMNTGLFTAYASENEENE